MVLCLCLSLPVAAPRSPCSPFVPFSACTAAPSDDGASPGAAAPAGPGFMRSKEYRWAAAGLLARVPCVCFAFYWIGRLVCRHTAIGIVHSMPPLSRVAVTPRRPCPPTPTHIRTYPTPPLPSPPPLTPRYVDQEANGEGEVLETEVQPALQVGAANTPRPAPRSATQGICCGPPCTPRLAAGCTSLAHGTGDV